MTIPIALQIMIAVYCFTGSLFFIYLIVTAILPERNYALTVNFNEDLTMSDTNFTLPGAFQIATATIRDSAGVPVPGAVFDTTPSWVFSDPAVASGSAVGLQTFRVTPLAVGVTTLTVTGVYLGNTLTANATVTVTAAEANFAVTIDWTPAPAV